MALNINARFGELMSSQKWNERFNTLYGTNAVIDGFDISLVRDRELIVTPGKLVIGGCEIVEDSLVRIINIPKNYVTAANEFSVVARYVHNPVVFEILLKERGHILEDNELSLAKIAIGEDLSINIENTEKFPSLIEILTIIKENPGDKIFQTLEERDTFPEDKLYIGFSCFVVDVMKPYIYKGDGEWICTFSNAVYIGNETPPDESMLWVNNEDEEISASLNSDVLKLLAKAIKEVKDIADEANYAIKYELDAGYFNDLLPGEDPDNPGEPDPNAPDLPNGAAGTVNKIILKRGLKQDLEDLNEGELAFCIDTEELYIGNKGLKKLLAKVGGVGGGSGSQNVTGEYVELIAPNKSKYRVTVNDDGDLIAYNSIVDTAEPPALSENGRFKGLLINKVYGGGHRNSNTTPCSHGFIELYNNTENTYNLKGLSIQYAEYLGEWKSLPLRGIVKPFTSFLIRCAEHTDITRPSTRVKVKDFDMSWDIALSDAGMKVLLTVGTEPSTHKNPANIDGKFTKSDGYIDLIGFGGEDVSRIIDAYEGGYLHLGSKYVSVQRRDFADTDNGINDLEVIDLRVSDPEVYGPRSTKFGQWNFYYNKIKMDPLQPNMINICFGKDGDTSRTFTWQTLPTKKGYLKYKKKGDPEFITVPTKKMHVSQHDTDVTVHSVIIKNLTPGTYIYKAGQEARWSDEYEFEVKVPQNSDEIRFLHVTDQQGWTEEEYTAWEKANAFIEKEETYDFILNTGDISQNANRAFEWRYYFDMAKDNTSKFPHMTCCGNNDLIDKKDPTAFTYYTTCEDSMMPSVHSWNYGYIHFICLNSNVEFKPEWSIAKQVEWVREDMAKPENQKRWTIVYMHESPYTIVKTPRVSPFIDVFAEVGVDLVLCGHHHCYSRSKKMGAQGPGGTDVVDEANGVTYVMSQATGFKTSGKQRPVDGSPWFAYIDRQGDPCYIMWSVTYDRIRMYPYRMINILPLLESKNKEVEKILFDGGFELTK